MSAANASAPQTPPPQGAGSARRRSARRPLGIVLAVLVAFLLGAFLLFQALTGATTVTVTNVGALPLEGIVILAVSDLGPDVRVERPIGRLGPREARKVEGLFSGDTNLGLRFRTPEGRVLEERLPVYLGSPMTQSVAVDLAADGVARARVRRWPASAYDVERQEVRRGLGLDPPTGPPPR